MDVHLWAKLDQEGRLESVQSSCTQPSPVCNSELPVNRHDGTNIQPWTSTTARSEKFVPYIEKKDLVYKLDAKVDEMALIITQMAELNKRVKVQEKLIAQYEEKLNEYKKTKTALERENEQLKKMIHPFCKSSSLNTTMMNCQKSGRPSSWPIGNRGFYFHDKQDAMDVNNFDQSEHETLHCDNSKGDSAEAFKVKRPSTLVVTLDKSNLSSKDNEEDNTLCCTETPVQSVYSYVKRQYVYTNENDSTTEIKAKLCSIGPRDHDGYLDMNQARVICDKTDSFYSFSHEIKENVQFENRRSDVACRSCCENEAIHSTWIDVKNGNFITRHDDTVVVCGDSIEPKDSNHDYVSIHEEDLQEDFDRPPIPNPRTSRLHRSHTNGDSCPGSQTFPKDLRIGQPARDRSLSLPSEPLLTFPPKSQRKDGKPKMLVKSKSSYSFEKLKHQGPFPDYLTAESDRSYDVKKDDDLNKVLKDMRTTMEWNKSKKKLISRSHHSTVDNVEKRLKSTVQDVYSAYITWCGEQGSKSKKFSKEKLLKKMKNIGKHELDDLQCDDFMSKCLDLVHRTVHQVKTP